MFHSRFGGGGFPSPKPETNLEGGLDAAQIGFRFAVTKDPDEQAPPGLDKQIFDAAKEGKLDELLGICQEWAGHPVIGEYKDGVCKFYEYEFAFSRHHNKHQPCVSFASRIVGIP